MKKFIYIIALLFLLVACNEELQIDTKQPTIDNKTRAFTSQTFSFDSVTKPEIWKTFQTLEEMQSACQIPDDVFPISARRSWCKYVWTTLCLETSLHIMMN